MPTIARAGGVVNLTSSADPIGFHDAYVAGHPMVGTAIGLANQRPDLNTAAFEIPAGIVRVEIERGADGTPVAASIALRSR